MIVDVMLTVVISCSIIILDIAMYNNGSLCDVGGQIVKQEWPHNWTTFVSDIVGASKTSESLCTNNMAILKLLRSTLPARLYTYVLFVPSNRNCCMSDTSCLSKYAYSVSGQSE